MIQCCGCGSSFAPTGKGRRCPPCRRAYDAEWRTKRAALGLPTGGTKTWAPEKREAWQSAYYVRADVRARKAAQMKESAARHPERVKARRLVRSEIEAGRMMRAPCEVCGAAKTDAHHDDYSRPRDVRWLCRAHHDQLHAKAEGA